MKGLLNGITAWIWLWQTERQESQWVWADERLQEMLSTCFNRRAPVSFFPQRGRSRSRLEFQPSGPNRKKVAFFTIRPSDLLARLALAECRLLRPSALIVHLDWFMWLTVSFQAHLLQLRRVAATNHNRENVKMSWNTSRSRLLHRRRKWLTRFQRAYHMTLQTASLSARAVWNRRVSFENR